MKWSLHLYWLKELILEDLIITVKKGKIPCKNPNWQSMLWLIEQFCYQERRVTKNGQGVGEIEQIKWRTLVRKKITGFISLPRLKPFFFISSNLLFFAVPRQLKWNYGVTKIGWTCRIYFCMVSAHGTAYLQWAWVHRLIRSTNSSVKAVGSIGSVSRQSTTESLSWQGLWMRFLFLLALLTSDERK